MEVRAAAFEPAKPLAVTHVVLDGPREAFDLMHEGKSIRSVVTF